VLNNDAVVMDGHKLLTIEIGSALVVAPMIVWLALYVAARWGSISLRAALPWLRILRYVTWGSAIALYIVHFAHDRFPWAYGAAVFTFSAGLALPESWVKRRFAPDLIESNSPGGWWPSKRD
jgi:hypothetical protein